MKKILFLVVILFGLNVNGQTLSDIQKQNARATGYAIIAAKNPGVDFTIYLVPWDGVNTLEYNANTQINVSWHAQCAIKGNHFGQTFDGTNFTGYSSVVTSQEAFDMYKSTGTQWWIVCSTLPPFSPGVNESQMIKPTVLDYSPILTLKRSTNTGGYIEGIQSKLYDGTNNWFFGNWNDDKWIVSKGDHQSPKFVVGSNGNVGIGTDVPQNKLEVIGKSSFSDNMKVNAKIEAKEIKVTNTPTADFVFEETYSLPKLDEVEKHIKEKKHLPEIASAKEMEKEGVNVGEFQIKLLQKIEELTLYVIEQKKQIEALQTAVKNCK